QVLWLLSFLQKKGIRVVNNPQSLLLYNEKLLAYTHKQSPPSLVSFSREKIIAETKKMYQAGQRYIILKPLDLFSGIGVTKITLKEKNKKWDESSFEKKLIILQKKFTGPLVLQSFLSQVYKGEVRALYFKGKELGSILKIPKAGKFLSNIAQGGTFHPCKLNKNQKKICDEISKQLFKEGILFVAFDVLGDLVTEVNITCPGLLVEVSQAYKRNLALEMNFN
ncbi:MAG: hypothetical protein KBD63_04265, partial [Bacteriovoracaceae bacterium]|nr:hypothetical protein [Bacteriovoracaceae bacterium]